MATKEQDTPAAVGRYADVEARIPLAGISHLDLARLMYPTARDPGHQLRMRLRLRGVQPDSHVRRGRYVTAVYNRDTAIDIVRPVKRGRKSRNAGKAEEPTTTT